MRASELDERELLFGSWRRFCGSDIRRRVFLILSVKAEVEKKSVEGRPPQPLDWNSQTELQKSAMMRGIQKNPAFRPLNDNERNIITKSEVLWETGFNDLCVSYERLGRFIVCIILSTQSGRLWRGVSHCALDDRFNRIRGEVVAFRRAITQSNAVSTQEVK